jgi:two-component system, chemotaxis family, chemotaxis protein CheY
MGSTKRTVLIADDSAVARRQLADILEGSGEYVVVGQAKNGVQAVKLFAQLKPMLTCLDMVMPVMDGTQALRAIRSSRPDAKVVMVTSMGGVVDRVLEVSERGASAVLIKPLVDEDVLSILRNV